jgi:hypothetical protein
MGSVSVPPSGGGNGKAIDLGTGTSFNVSNISGYKNFTVANFIVCIQSFSSSGGANIAQGYAQSGGTSASVSPTINKSYDSSTGVLTVSANNTSASNRVNVSGAATQFLTASVSVGSISYHAFLIP